MTTPFYHYGIQLKDAVLGAAIVASGGTVYVAKAGLPDKEALFDKNGATLTNPIQMTAGFIDFYTGVTDQSVDLYIMAPGGQFMVVPTVTPSGPNEIAINTSQKRQVAKIPFNIGDTAAATETDTGFDMPNPSMFLDRLHGASIDVIVNESGKTIDVGTLSSETGGDANGLIAASSLASKGQVIATNGALFSTNAPAASDANTAKSLSYTLSSASAAAKGFIELPYQLA